MNLERQGGSSLHGASNQQQSRISNQLMILKVLRHQPMSRADLARASGLTRAAITSLANQLLKRNLIRETKTNSARAGRKPTLLIINPQYAWIIALNLSRNGHHIGLADFSGQIIISRDIPDLKPDNLTTLIPQAIHELLEQSGDPARPVSGLGITAPGPLVRTQGKIIDPPDFTQWHLVPVVDLLRSCIREPIYLENNAAAAAMAEYFQGTAANYRHFLVLTVDSGIGGGLYLSGQPYQGAGGFGQEIGHMTIDWQGRHCACGHQGCLERYASVPAILAEGKRRWMLWQQNCEKTSSQMLKNGILTNTSAPESWPDLMDRVMAGDPLAGRLLDLEAEYLAAGLINLRNFLEIDAVILSGELTYKPAALLECLRSRLSARAMTRNTQEMKIEASKLDQSAGLTAAAALVLQHQYIRRTLLAN